MGVINYTTAKINDLLKKVEEAPEKLENGKTPVFITGTTTTLDPGMSATAEVVLAGTDSEGNPQYKINLGVPKGLDGVGGSGGGVADSVQWANVLNKPSWVNSATKPSYTASEVGALPAGTFIPSKTSQLTNDSKFLTSSDFKTINGESIVGSGNISLSGTGGITDAPKDGKTYGRNNGSWVETSQMEEAPTDGFAYARKNGAWTEVLKSTKTALLDDYSKAESYSSILPTDSINDAIGKLEAGINNGEGTSDDIYYLPNSIISLTSKTTSEEIASIFSGIFSEIADAINGGKKFYISGNNNYSAIPAIVFNFFNTTINISFLIRKADSLSLVNIKVFRTGNQNSIDILNTKGLYLSSDINNLTSESSSSDIANVFGDLDDLKDLYKNIASCSNVYTNVSGLNGSRMQLSINMTYDSSKYYIYVSGVSGSSFSAYLSVGYLYIEYDISSNTYTCTKVESQFA